MKKMKFTLVLCACILLVASCKSFTLLQETQTTTKQKVSLGTIGLDKDFILQSGFNNSAIPNYGKPIKVSASNIPFTKSTYKSFLKAEALQFSNVNISYIDSLKAKPHFIRLKIADKVSIIEALNHDDNRGIKNYLANNKTANLVNGISIAFNKQDLELLQQADAIFLVESGIKHYALQLYKEGHKTDVIQFSNGTVFAYKTANCCWQENKRRQLNIVDYTSEFNDCPSKTYRSAERAKKEIKLF